MEDPALTLVIDTLLHPAPFDADGGIAPVVRTLQSADARRDITFNPPVILCAEQDMARARGAFLVTGDGDGRVIAFAPDGTATLRRSVVSAPLAFVLKPGEVFPTQPNTAAMTTLQDCPLLPASLKGVWVPDPAAWRALCQS